MFNFLVYPSVLTILPFSPDFPLDEGLDRHSEASNSSYSSPS